MKLQEAAQTAHEQRRRGDHGLTTLEWLLIVAAVAGLAALAVVLVTNVVGDTSEQISGQSARLTAARIAGNEIMNDANRNAADQPASAKTFDKWANHYRSKCDIIEITYGDADITTEAMFAYNSSGGGHDANDAVAAGSITLHDVDGGTGAGYNADGLAAAPTTSGAAVAHCVVKQS